MGSKRTPERCKPRLPGSLNALSLQVQVPEGTESTPVSAITSSPRFFTPPERPSSTPFPQLDQDIEQFHFQDDYDSSSDSSFTPEYLALSSEDSATHAGSETCPSSTAARPSLGNLPVEIVENILDHIFGFRVSGSSRGHGSAWISALRHARRKELANLALVNQTWRRLVQERIYRHINLRAKTSDMYHYGCWFGARPHLRQYVKHLEVWFPVFETHQLPSKLHPSLRPPENCSLEEVFGMAKGYFPQVRVLTLQGGDRKKAPKVRNWRTVEGTRFAELKSVRTLICKGQWNLIRSECDSRLIFSALPNLQEWQAVYDKPKSKGYLTMATILPTLPKPTEEGRACLVLPNLLTYHTVQPYLGAHLHSLNLFMENNCHRETMTPKHADKVRAKLHFCRKLAQATVTLKHLSFTGRFCHVFFDQMAKLHDSRTTSLKSVDLTLKNTCRTPQIVPNTVPSGSGIHDITFIGSFERLVISAIKSLSSLVELEYLRIRFVDLCMFNPVLVRSPTVTLTPSSPL